MIGRDDVYNIGIIAHIDAGKTTVTERMLFFTQKEHRIGEVHEGTATMDWMDEERERGITITAACTTVFWNDKCINIVDTPGHVDFTAEVERSLRILDGAVIVFSAVEGVEAQSETVWHQSDHYKVPKIAFINKLDRIGAEFDRVVGEIRDTFHVNPLPLQMPIYKDEEFTGIIDLLEEKAYFIPDKAELGNIKEIDIPADLQEAAAEARDSLMEQVAEQDDELTEKYLEGKPLPLDKVRPIIKKMARSNEFVPVLCGSALKNRGVRFLMDAVLSYLPTVSDIDEVEGHTRDTNEPLIRAREVKEPFSALAFKVQNDVHGGITFLRIYSGTLKAKGRIYNSTRDRIEKISHIMRMHASHRERIDEAVAGDIVAVVGLKFTVTGDTLCTKDEPIVYELLHFPETVVSMSIEPSTSADEEKMENVLELLTKDDPTFKYHMDQETGQMLISGMGELHLEVIRHRITKDYNLKVQVGNPRVSYRETVKTEARVTHEFSSQLGDVERYAQVEIEVIPGPKRSGFEFENTMVLPGFPPEYAEAVLSGIKDSIAAGPVLGYPVIDIIVRLINVRMKSPGSDEVSFRSAASLAFREAMQAGAPILMEPYMKVVCVIPEEHVGDLINFFNGQRGEVMKSDMKGTQRQVEASAPMTEMFGFASRFRSITAGRGSFTMEPLEYREIPEKLRKKTSFF